MLVLVLLSWFAQASKVKCGLFTLSGNLFTCGWRFIHMQAAVCWPNSMPSCPAIAAHVIC